MDLSRPSANASSTRCLIDDILVDAGQRKLWRGTQILPVTRLTFELLLALVERAPNLVSHDELIERVWGPRRIVSPETLAQCVLRLRQSLGDHAASPRYLESIRGQGYRLIPPVQPLSDASDSPVAETRDADESPFPRRTTGRRGRMRWAPTATIASLAAVSVFVALGALELGGTTPDATAVASVPIRARTPERLARSIAVLPIVDIGTAPTDAIVADGIHADILNELARIQDLNVIARSTMAQFADSALTIREIASDLNVESVMQIDMRLMDQRVELTAELIDGVAGTQRWFGRYETHLSGIYGLQRELVSSIAQELGARLSDAEWARLQDRPTTSAEAYEFLLAAADAFEVDSSDSAMIARSFLDQAIALDPEFAVAYGFKGLIYAYGIDEFADSAEDPRAELAERARLAESYALTALALDRGTVIAHRARANAQMRSWNLNAAKRAFESALEHGPNDIRSLSEFAFFSVCALGDHAGLQYAERALELDPRNPRVHEMFGRALNCTGDQAAALAALRRSVDLDATTFRPRALSAYFAARVLPAGEVVAELQALEPMLTEVRLQSYPPIALTYRSIGRPEDAARVVAQFEALDGHRRTNLGNSVFAYLAVDDEESAYRALEKAVERLGPGSGYLTLLAIRHNLRGVAALDEPRFVSLRERIRSLD